MPGPNASADANNNARKNLLSLRRWMIISILGTLVTLLKLNYTAEEIIILFKSHPVSEIAFISVLFLDFATLFASHKPSMFDYHPALDQMGFRLDALLGIIGLLAIEPFLGWFLFAVWSRLVIAMAYKLYKHYEQSIKSLYTSILQRLPMLHNMMAHHSSREEELQPRASHRPSEEEEVVPPRASHRPREEEFNSSV